MKITELKTGKQVNTVPPMAVALGNFDGVHAGHRRVITDAVAWGQKNQIKSAVWCFADNPKKPSEIISTAEEKTEIFKALGADYVIFEDFEAVRSLSPSEFVLSYLKALPAAAVFCGFNFRFGKGAAGDSAALEALCSEANIYCKSLPAVMSGETAVSSTVIRALIKSGDVEKTEKLLLRPYSVTGVVSHGRHLGNTLGFPTVNQNFTDGKVIPRSGVYLSLTYIDGKGFPSVSNVGDRPTVNGHHLRLETHIIGWEGDLYGERLTVELKKFCRPEKKFSSEEELKNAVLADISAAKDYFSRRTFDEL